MMTEQEKEAIEKECPALAMFAKIAECCAKINSLVTYSAAMLYGIGTITQDDHTFTKLTSNTTARGVEAFFQDSFDGRKYHLIIEPIKKGE